MCNPTTPASDDAAGAKATTAPNTQNTTLPVVIAGGGPCGLTAALNLQRHDVPFCIYERASREKLFSNAGSGIDMAPSAVQILDNLGVASEKYMQEYQYMHLASMDGKPLKTYVLHDFQVKVGDTNRNFGFAGRSNLQQALLERIMANTSNAKQEDEILHCGVSVTGYENHDDHVQVLLSDGSTVKASALLACDGIHSKIRQHMHRNNVGGDDLNYCGQEVWWGKVTLNKGSELDQELQRLNEQVGNTKGDNLALALLGTPKCPGGFFSCELDNTHAWVYFVKGNKKEESKNANQSNDLTRRGGSVLTEDDKKPRTDGCHGQSPQIDAAHHSKHTCGGHYPSRSL